MRSGPGIQYEIVTKVVNNEIFYVISQVGDRWLVRTQDGKYGYMHRSRIQPKREDVGSKKAEPATPKAEALAAEPAQPGMSAGKRADGIFFDDFDRMDFSRWSFEQTVKGSMRVVNGQVELYDVDMPSEHYAQLESGWFIAGGSSRVEVRSLGGQSELWVRSARVWGF